MLVVVALVVPILLLAHSIGKQAKEINDASPESVHNTAALAELHTTIDSRRGDHRRAPARPHQAGRLTMRPVALVVDTTENLWWGAVIGGFVVVLAVAALLTILVLLVRTIDRRVVADPRHAAAGRGQHGRHRADRARPPRGVDAVLAEGLEHHLFLGRVLGKVRS